MSKFVTIMEDIGGDTREVAINLEKVNEIRDDGDSLTFSFGPENETAAIFDDRLRAALASHGIVFSENSTAAKAA